MKTYTAAEFEVEFYRALYEWVNGGKAGTDPRKNWEFKYYQSEDWHDGREWLCGSDRFSYRWKPAKKRTVIIDGVELAASENVAPKIDTKYFLYSDTEEEFHWNGDFFDIEWLSEGRIFLTAEDAQAMYEAQRKQRLGGAV